MYSLFLSVSRIWLCGFLPAATCRFGTFYGHENRNIIRSFKVAEPWHKNYMLQSKEIPKFSHRLLFFISYSLDSSESDDFPEIVMNGNLALALIIL
ncbi:hypothetical protein BDE02_12G011900 [Populus trichocarpa]|nr:hypothetical protein BDE02_12G011900 [Populus trichocarpa]KAI5568391.1 hypothetical protein BDE02_12G011900 [Populus trichocarpa]KAI5568392.1 hypothetical protein BDE02_12G011900 [Populus trichocarpa]KAI5568393.1 hypothetical protein BDE02_12G011900 [Populus trichocarpa]KAI5568394.1 hypothetical protein BDE02_12G011900 [Populus trichocarpa]